MPASRPRRVAPTVPGGTGRARPSRRPTERDGPGRRRAPPGPGPATARGRGSDVEWVETTGRSVEEAKDAALDQVGASGGGGRSGRDGPRSGGRSSGDRPAPAPRPEAAPVSAEDRTPEDAE